jgi:hypothetical protein
MAKLAQPRPDGETRFKAGDNIPIKGEGTPDYSRAEPVRAQVANLRGEFLAGCFDLEMRLDAVVGILLFRELNWARTGEIFRDTVLRERLSFSAKRELFDDLRAERIPQSKYAQIFSERAGQVNTIRNLIAHYPCFIEISNSASGAGFDFTAVIPKGATEYLLTEKLIGEWREHLSTALSAGRTLFDMLSDIAIIEGATWADCH